MKTYFSANMKLRMFEHYGQLKAYATENGKERPLPKTYVKVYKKLQSGSHEFYKDGYTDLRGRFDYATLSGSESGPAKQFAIFVCHEKEGSLIKEAKPPNDMNAWAEFKSTTTY